MELEINGIKVSTETPVITNEHCSTL